jgi:hypothetical protein
MDDISEILKSWPFDAGRVQARLFDSATGAAIIQLRIDLGLLQMWRDGRPDGERPGGFPSILDQYVALADRVEQRGAKRTSLSIPPEDYPEFDRELLQYYHRRIALFSLGDYARAARDAQHSLRLIEMIRRHVKDKTYTGRHDRMVPFLLLERGRAKALLALGRNKPEVAVRHVEEAGRLIQAHLQGSSTEATAETARELIFLRRWARRIRSTHHLGPSLERQLEEAVEREDYDEAARLRDRIKRGQDE